MTKPILPTALAALATTIALPGCSEAAPVEAIADRSVLHNVAVLIDLSDSFALLESHEIANTLSRDIGPAFDKLDKSSTVLFRTFGDYSVATTPGNSLVTQRTINKNYRPDAAQAEVAGLIRSIPVLVERGEIEAQGSTNIVAALADLARRVDCSADNVFDVVLVSDGSEASADFGFGVPAPEKAIFQGCGTLHIIGLTGASHTQTEALAEAWQTYAAAAGFADIRIVR